MTLKRIAAATTLFAALSGTAALASVHAAPAGRPVLDSGAQPNVCNVIYLSDNTTALDYIYKGSAPYTAFTPSQMPAVDDGWGLYATKSLIYAGAAPNQINVYKPCGTQVGFTLTTLGAGAPVSIAADNANNVYATELGQSTIDWFAGGVDTPGAYDTPRSPGLPFYLAVDNVGNVYTSGWDPTNSFEQIDICSPHMTTCAPCEAVPAPSWPGGVALDRNQHLIVENQYGSIYVYNAGCGTQASTVNYSPTNAFHFTAIALNQPETKLWGDKIFNVSQPGCATPYCMDGQAMGYNAATGVIGAILPAVRTAPIRVGEKPGSGIALWPPGPV